MNLEKRSTIITVIVVGLVVIGLGIFGIIKQTGSQTDAEPTIYLDPGSGEKIIDNDKSPQGSDLSLENAIIYPGFSSLLDRGLSPVQIQSIQSVIAKYSLSQPDKFKEVSLTLASMRHLLPKGDSNTHTLTFDIKVNRSDDYHITADYNDTTSILTKLYKSDKTTLLIEG